MHPRFLLAIVAAALVALPAATAGAGTSTGLRATFVDIYSQCPTHPPTLVFCTSSGTVVGYGAATGDAYLTGPLVPMGDCFGLSANRTIVLANGAGSLTLTETGTKCPPSEAANDVQGTGTRGDPYTVDKTITGVKPGSGTGVFAGVCGASGSDVNHSAGNAQASVVSATLTTSC